MIDAVKVHQEELELLLRLVENLTVGARVEGRMYRAVLGLEPLLEDPDVCGGIGPASGPSITQGVRGVGKATASGRHDCSRPRQLTN